MLKNGAVSQIEEKTTKGFTALSLASEFGHIDVCDILLNYYDEKGFEREYNIAKEKGNKKIIKLLQNKLKSN